MHKTLFLCSFIVASVIAAAIAWKRPLFTEFLPINGWSYIFLLGGRCLEQGMSQYIAMQIMFLFVRANRILG
jgi:hypothetical protein